MLLDSVIVIDCLNGTKPALAFVKETPGLVVLVVTRAEVIAGTPPGGEAVTEAFLESFPLLGIDRAIADRTGQLRKTERWKLPDAFQAALAEHHGLKLATRNTKDFRPDRHGFVVVPYTV